VLGFRLFEGVVVRTKNPYVMLCLAVLLTTLVINAPALLSNIFTISYFMFLYISLVPMSVQRDVPEIQAEDA
jgi:hypothetical protein